MKCRHCNSLLSHTFLNLGFSPPSNAYLTSEDLFGPEVYYPLSIKVCDNCWLVQTEDYAQASEFFNSNYAYFSSTSTSWLEHARSYTKKISDRLCLSKNSLVIEIASNDGYLLKNFVEIGIPCIGIEPTDSTAQVAEGLGIPVLREFFGEIVGKRLALEKQTADLIIGNNVYAHVPDINDFTRGLKATLKSGGTITLEFPHLMRLIEQTQFDTVYHEHFSYLSLNTVSRIFEKFGLRVWSVEELQTHGGSLRVYGCHVEDLRKTEDSVFNLLQVEEKFGLQKLETYLSFQPKADKVKNDLLDFLINQKKAGKKVIAYGAAAKGNTLLNYAGVKSDLLPFIFDAAKAKQNKYMPGSHIPILEPEKLNEAQPDFVLILPWNIASEVKEQISNTIGTNVKFLTAIPTLSEL